MTDEVREQQDSIDTYRRAHMNTVSRVSIRIDVEETGDQQIISITPTENLEPAVMIGIIEMAKLQIIDVLRPTAGSVSVTTGEMVI